MNPNPVNDDNKYQKYSKNNYVDPRKLFGYGRKTLPTDTDKFKL